MIYTERIADVLGEAEGALDTVREKLALALGYAITAGPEGDFDPDVLAQLTKDADELMSEILELNHPSTPDATAEPQSEDQPHPDSARLRALADDLDRYHTPDGRHADMVRAVGVELVSLGNDIRNERH